MSPSRIDWSQLWYPGPRRAFTAVEMALAGQDGPSATLKMAVLVNCALMATSLLPLVPAGHLALVVALLAGQAVAGAALGSWLWWRPWRGPLMRGCAAWSLGMVLLALWLRWLLPVREERLAVSLVLVAQGALVALGLWFVVVWRAQQVEGRLKAHAERRQAIEMAQRLAAAQLEPHFLFNTLASVQHWVHTQDDRAAPLLDALVGYLRATLPMFSRPLQPLSDELEAVRRYLQVMGARFGPRLPYP